MAKWVASSDLCQLSIHTLYVADVGLARAAEATGGSNLGSNGQFSHLSTQSVFGKAADAGWSAAQAEELARLVVGLALVRKKADAARGGAAAAGGAGRSSGGGGGDSSSG